MKTLVIGGTGMVGSVVVQELLSRNQNVSVLTRSREKAADLPEGVEGVIGELKSPGTVTSIFDGADQVFLINTVSPTEATEGLMAVIGAGLAGVKKLVYVSVHEVDKAPHLPHFGSKIPIEMAIKESGITYTILRPNNFYQNDYWFKDAILQYGAYPQPIGDAGISRVDVRDIAEAAAIALTTDTYNNTTINLVGPEVLTGKQTAEIWGKVLGKPINYGGNDLDAWEKQMLPYMPDWMVFDFKHMFAFFQKNGLKATSDDIRLQTKMLGHAPRAFEEFAKETAATW